MKSKVWVWGLLVLIVINVSALITIGANTWMFKNNRTERTERFQGRRASEDNMVQLLGLDEMQTQSFNEIETTSRENMRTLFLEMRELREKLNEALGEVDLDMNEINAVNERIVDADRKIRQHVRFLTFFLI